MSAVIESEVRAPGIPQPVDPRRAAESAERAAAIDAAVKSYRFVQGSMPDHDFRYLIAMAFGEGYQLGIDQLARAWQASLRGGAK